MDTLNTAYARPLAATEPDAARETLTDLVSRFTGYVGKRLPTDVVRKLMELREREDAPLSKTVYDSMFDNLAEADRLDRPCCQDTGVVEYFLRAGADFPWLGALAASLDEALAQASREAPLRPNAVETFDEKNTGTNVGTRVPWVEWEIVPDEDSVTLEVYMAGGGCSLPGAAKVLMPSAGYEGVTQFVFDVITTAGVNACPPLVVGVGVSTSVETAAALSKRAVLRPLGTHHPHPRAARMEQLIEDGLNEIGIGPQGLSGKASVLGVNIESSARHPSTIGVAVSTGCWANRRGTLRIHPDLTYEVLSHQGAVL